MVVNRNNLLRRAHKPVRAGAAEHITPGEPAIRVLGELG